MKLFSTHRKFLEPKPENTAEDLIEVVEDVMKMMKIECIKLVKDTVKYLEK